MKAFVRRYRIHVAGIVLGLVLTPAAIEYATIHRGYGGAIGGEYLLVPLFLVIAQLVTWGIRDINALIKEELQNANNCERR